jgi:hypothetical protein
MSELWRVYVDEAGDRGISEASSGHFVVAAIIVRDQHETSTRQQLSDLRSALGRHDHHVLHFQRFSHSHRVKAVQDLASSAVDAIFSSILCKRGFNQQTPAGEMAYITRPDPMYLWAVRLLLERVSWFVRDNGGGRAIVTFAHVRRFKSQKLHDYRVALRGADTGIHWPSFDTHPFRINSPDRIELLQLADTAASAIYRAVEPDQFGNVERRYLEELLPKVYRRGTRPVTSYGLKVFPSGECSADGKLRWLAAL